MELVTDTTGVERGKAFARFAYAFPPSPSTSRSAGSR